MVVVLILFTLFGHVAIWVGIANRVHALRVPQWFNVISSYFCHVCLLGLPLLIAWWQWQAPSAPASPATINVESAPGEEGDTAPATEVKPETTSRNPLFRRSGWPVLYYMYCWGVAGLFLPWWIVWRLTSRPPPQYTAGAMTVVDTTRTLGRRPALNWFGQIVTALPLNEVFRLRVDEKTLTLPRLPADFPPLVITHLSDWHLKGRVDRAYYEEVVRVANATEPDLICVTGDLFDKVQFLDWIPTTFARLRAKYGVCFILGNHDIRHSQTERSRELLRAAGLKDVGVAPWLWEYQGRKIYVAGNELPWIPLAPELAETRAEGVESKSRRADLRILLSHSPDQFKWASRQQFDLMLAGHTHGGQIRLPWIGAVYAPSWYGTKYAGGVYYHAPTLLHVTRGVGSEFPFRWNCPPEVARLTIVPAT